MKINQTGSVADKQKSAQAPLLFFVDHRVWLLLQSFFKKVSPAICLVLSLARRVCPNHCPQPSPETGPESAPQLPATYPSAGFDPSDPLFDPEAPIVTAPRTYNQPEATTTPTLISAEEVTRTAAEMSGRDARARVYRAPARSTPGRYRQNPINANRTAVRNATQVYLQQALTAQAPSPPASNHRPPLHPPWEFPCPAPQDLRQGLDQRLPGARPSFPFFDQDNRHELHSPESRHNCYQDARNRVDGYRLLMLAEIENGQQLLPNVKAGNILKEAYRTALKQQDPGALMRIAEYPGTDSLLKSRGEIMQEAYRMPMYGGHRSGRAYLNPPF